MRCLVVVIGALLFCSPGTVRADGGVPGVQPLRMADISEVQVGGEIGRRIDLTINENLLELDLAPGGLFLGPFEKQTWPEGGGNYGGYVGLGKTLDALVRFAAYKNDPKLVALKEQIVRTLLATQTDEGYIGTYRADGRITSAFDLHEMVYLLQALADDFLYYSEPQSRDAARELADFIMQGKTAPWIFENIQDVRKLNIERAFLAVGNITGDSKYRDYGVAVMDLRHWQPAVEGHAYWFLNRCVAQLDLYRAEGLDPLFEESHKVVEFLTANDGLALTGTCGIGEVFNSDQIGIGNLGESCATAYLIRLCHHLLQLEGNSLYGDIMERSIFNALFAAQSADGRHLRYYTCLEGPRAYMNADTYCCPGNWRRIVSELPEMICYGSEDGVLVNLYAESMVPVRLRDDLSVTIRTETDYPNSGQILLRIEPSRPAEFSIQLRIPGWCAKPKASVNGKAIPEVAPGAFLNIQRQWQAGDRVRLTLPMEPRVILGRKRQAGKAAVMRGPVVFCLATQDKSADELSRVRARIAEVDAALGGLSGKPVNLADIVGGGGGFGAGRACSGIDPRSGKIVGGMIGEIWWNTANEYRRTESPFIDGIVVPNGARGPVPISSTDLTIEGVPMTCDMTNGYLMNGPKNQEHWSPADGPEFGATVSPMTGQPQPWYTTRGVDVDYTDPGHSMIGVEANKAVTFDLAAIRSATGYGALTFQSVIGYGSREEPTVDVAIYVDGRPRLERTALTRAPLAVNIPLESSARFLTIMVTDQNGKKNEADIIPSDAVILGDPMLIPDSNEASTAETANSDRRRLEREWARLRKQDRRYLESLDRANEIVLDAGSISGPIPDASVRPDGIALRIKGWSPGRDTSQAPDLTLQLSEFPHPEGRATYFHFNSLAAAQQDELALMKLP